MRPGFYKHVYGKDVVIKVLKSYYIPEKGGWKVRVNYLNVSNPDKHFLISDTLGPVKDTVFIARDQISKWERFNATI